MNKLVAGTIAGLVATAPMTMSMGMMYRQLPPEERYPLPPRQITDQVMDEAGVKHELSESERGGLSLLNHFAYGAAAGTVYGLMSRTLLPPSVLGGIGFGLAVWAGSYLGWLPAAGLLRPATEQPAGRNALMISAHVVWGAATGLLTSRLANR